MMAYERLPPEGPCVSPEGHEALVLETLHSAIPEAIVCPNCGKEWSIIVFEVIEP